MLRSPCARLSAGRSLPHSARLKQLAGAATRIAVQLRNVSGFVRDACPDHHARDKRGSACYDAVLESLPDYFEALVDRLMMPSKLRELNVPEDSLPMLARDAMLQQRLLVNNPRKTG